MVAKTFERLEKLEKVYLETLSMKKLLLLSDDYGIDVTEQHDRCFLIGELLRLRRELDDEETEDALFDVTEDIQVKQPKISPKDPTTLPTYNSTEIEFLLKNPSWAFIYWNISHSDQTLLQSANVTDMKIRVNCFETRSQEKASIFFDFHIAKEDTGRYFLLPANERFFRVDLLFYLNGIIDILTSSDVIEIPKRPKLLEMIRMHRPEKQNCTFSEVAKLSGIEDILQRQYKIHRQTFSAD